MKSLAANHQSTSSAMEYGSPAMEYGWIVRQDDQVFQVDTPWGAIFARRAVSCLVAPSVGDRVLLSFNDPAQGFILAILEREADTVTDLVLDGQVNLHARQGSLSLTADQDLVMGAGRELACAADNLKLHAHRGRVVMDKLSFRARVLDTQFKRIKSVAREVEQVFSQLTQRLTNAFRYVEEHEEVQAGSTRVLVEDTMTTHSKNAVHMAEEIIKLNADQVHLG